MWKEIANTLNQTFLNNSLWQYFGSVVAIILTLITFVVVRYVIDIWLKRLTQRTRSQVDDQLAAALRSPVLFLICVYGFYIALEILTLPKEPIDISKFLSALVTSLVIVDVAWFFYLAADILTFYLKRVTSKTATKLDDQLVPLVRRAIRILIVIIAILMIIQNLGYSVGSLLAGLGLGGLAFALAAKDSLSNMFGSITIFADRPFQIGDWIKTPGVEGVVEDIGFRSTRIRTFAKTLITIPNNQLANETVENMDARPERRVKMRVGLTYETTTAQMEQAVETIKDILRTHPGVSQKYWLVYFDEFGSSSLNIFVYYFSKSIVWAEYLQVRQDVNLEIMRRLEALGVSIAFPTQTIYLKKEIL